MRQLLSMQTQAISPRAFAMLLLLACMFGANHVAARIALDHGVDVATAVAVRSLVTAAVVAAIVWLNRVPLTLSPRHRQVMPLIATLVSVQSLCLYSSVARIPVGLALLAFNTYPLWTAAAAWAIYRHKPERAILVAMPVILFGLALALDVTGLASGLEARAQWGRIGAGVGFALVAGATFGLVLALTQHEVADLDGRLRTTITMGIVGVLALLASFGQGGLHWPNAMAGWWGLASLTLLYGTAFTIMFTLLPRLGVVGSSPILNVEPVAALAMAWLLLDQAISAIQVVGALLVVGAVMALGLRRRR
jgi:drug/metabolite transporter (DMT)-like permease